MDIDIEETLIERGRNYGPWGQCAGTAQELKQTLRRSAAWEHMPPAQQEALEMLMVKIARIVEGDPSYTDSWVDAIGYLSLGMRVGD